MAPLPCAHHWGGDCPLHSRTHQQSELVLQGQNVQFSILAVANCVIHQMDHHHRSRFAAFYDPVQSCVGLQGEDQTVTEAD